MANGSYQSKAVGQFSPFVDLRPPTIYSPVSPTTSTTGYVKNNGAAALNGDIHVNFWIID